MLWMDNDTLPASTARVYCDYINSVPVGLLPVGVLVYKDNPALCYAILVHTVYNNE